jgi:hypothetical protein
VSLFENGSRWTCVYTVALRGQLPKNWVCNFVFAQALSIIDTLGDRQSNYSACMVERDALHHTFYRFSPRFARAETAVLNKTETEEGSDRRAIAPFFG